MANKLRTWLWHNKEGAIIGGIIGLVTSLIVWNSSSDMNFFQSLDFITKPLRNIVETIRGTSTNGMWYWIYLPISIISIIIGAFIDSVWRKNR